MKLVYMYTFFTRFLQNEQRNREYWRKKGKQRNTGEGKGNRENTGERVTEE